MSEMCYFLHDDIDMGAHIYTCGYQKEMIWGECPCKDGISCDFFVSKSEVDKLVRQYVNHRGKEHEIAERKMIYLDEAIEEVELAFESVGAEKAEKWILENLNNLPSAQSEQNMGGWIKKMKVTESETCTSYTPEWYCKNCGEKYDPCFANLFVNYCYVCAADMRKGESNG